MRRGLVAMAKGVLWLATLAAGGLALIGLAVGILARTDWGHRRVLAFALPRIARLVEGTVRIGRLDGNLLRGLTVTDVAIDDREGQPALRVARIEATYVLWRLVHRTAEVPRLSFTGGWVRARRMDDGKLNLTELLRPSPEANEHPRRIILGSLTAAVEVNWDLPVAPGIAGVRGRLDLTGEARVDGPVIEARIDRLTAFVESPTALTVAVHGMVRSDGKSLNLDALETHVTSDGAALDRLWPSLKLAGPLSARIAVTGPIKRLALHATLEPATGTLTANGIVGWTENGPNWHLHLLARDLDPGALREGLPHGVIAIAASGSGAKAGGQVIVESVSGVVGGVIIDGQGECDLSGHGSAILALRAADLRRFPRVSAGPLSGRADAVARVTRDARRLMLEITAHGHKLALGSVAIARANVKAQILDRSDQSGGHLRLPTGRSLAGWSGRIDLRADDVTIAGRRIEALRVTGRDANEGLALHVATRGARGALQIDLHGHERLRGGRAIGVDATLDRLVVSANGRRWSSRHPAALHLGSALTVGGLELVSGSERAHLDGAFGFGDRAFRIALRGRSLDAAEIGALILPSQRLPHTQIDINVNGRGTLRFPIIEGQLTGAVDGWQPLGIGRIGIQLRASYRPSRIVGDLAVTSGGASLRATGEAAPALALSSPLRLDFALEGLPLAKLRPLLPLRLAALDGALFAFGHVAGTLRRPAIDATVRATGLRVGDLPPPAASLSVAWRGADLVLRSSVRLGNDAGALDVTARANSDAGEAITSPGRLLADLRDRAPLAITATVRRLQVERLPLDRLGIARPVDGGTVDATASLEGSLRNPRIAVRATVSDARRAGVFQQLGGTASLDSDGDRVKLAAAINLGAQRLVGLTGGARIDFARLLQGQPWRDGPVQLEATIPNVDLGRVRALAPGLPPLGGRLVASAHLGGTLASPSGGGAFTLRSLSIDGTPLAGVTGRARFENGLITAALRSFGTPAGALAVDAAVPLDATRPLALDARATHFDVGFLPGLVSALVESKGTLDGRLAITGTRAHPLFEGKIDVAMERLRLRSEPVGYRDFSLLATVHDGVLTLARLHLLAGDGSLAAEGRATLDGPRITRLDGAAKARSFSILAGSVAGWLDADLKISGATVGNELRGRADVVSGALRLPKLSGGKKLQSLAPLDDVAFDDSASRKAAQRAEAATTGPTARLVAHLPGPFYVRSREAHTELHGDLDLDVRGGSPSLTGHLAASSGWIDLIGRRYEIEHARAGFSGPLDNPDLDVRLTRQVGETTIAVELHGTARKPELRFSSDPPVYDQSQILGLLVSGDPSSPRASSRTLDQQVTGTVSSLLLGRIKSAVAPELPVDVFNVDTGAEGPTGLTQTRVEVGKYITDKIYISYVHQFGAPGGVIAVNSNEAHVEYRFLRAFEIDSSFGDAGVGGVDLYWTIRY